MAWNPSPEVAAARDFGRKFGKDIVLILALDEDEGEYKIVTFGKTKALCRRADRLGGYAGQGLYDGLTKEGFN